MVDKPGGKVALPALATIANTAKQLPQKEDVHQDNHLKERSTTDEIKCEPRDGQIGAMEQKQGGKGAAESLP